MTTTLRPMRAGELLDRTFSLLRQHFLLFVGISALPMLGQLLLSALVLLGTRFSAATPPAASAALVIVPFLVIFAGMFVLFTAAMGASTWAASRLWKGDSVSIRDAYRATAGRIASLIGSVLLLLVVLVGAEAIGGIPVVIFTIAARFARMPAILVGAVVALLGLAALAFIAWVWLGLGLAQPAIVLEKLGPLQGLRRSWRLAPGGRWHILMVYAMSFLSFALVQVVLMVPFFAAILVDVLHRRAIPIWMGILSNVLSAVTVSLLLPVMVIGLTLVYLNQRVIREGFDLQVMLDSMGAETPGQAAAGKKEFPAEGLVGIE